MKKKILFLFVLTLLFSLVGCGKNDSKYVIKNLEKKIKNVNSYKLSGVLEIANNDDTYQYDINVAYKKGDNYRVSLINKSNNHEQVILKNSEGVYVVTPSLNKSFKFQSDWPNNTSQLYLLHSILNDLKKDSNIKLDSSSGKYVFKVKANYPNNKELNSQKITINKDFKVEMVEVINSDSIPQMIMSINSIDYNYNFDDKYFELSSIIEQIEVDENEVEEGNKEKEENTEQTIKGINDIIYPLYIPKGTTLSNQEKISTDAGERIILTFGGDKPFLLVEENSSVSNEFSVIPTFGEPFFLADTIGALTNNSISWSSNGLDYYIVSDVMGQTELIEIASSITAIPTIK